MRQDIEASVIGGLLIGGLTPTASDVLATLEPEAFSIPLYRKAFEVIRKQARNRNLIDALMVAEACGEEHFTSILMTSKNCPSAANLKGYAGMVADNYHRRLVLEIMDEMREPIQSGTIDASSQAIDELVKRLSAIRKPRDEVKPVRLGEIITDYTDTLDRRLRNGEESDTLKTGIEELDAITGGMNAEDLVIIAARPGMGKAMALSEGILLADGTWTTHGEVKIGDRIASIDGLPSEVIGVFPQGKKFTYLVTFEDGRSVKCADNHLWEISSSRFTGKRVVDTDALAGMLQKTRYQGRIRVPSLTGDFGKNIPLDGWVIGALLGDGSLIKGIKFTNSEEYVLSRMSDAIAPLRLVKVGENDYLISNQKGQKNPLLDKLRGIGMIGKGASEKEIPAEIFSASKEIRTGVLTGLLETDGWVEKSGCIRFSSSSQKLAKGLVRLVRSLGGTAKESSRTGIVYTYKGEKHDGLDAHMVSMKLPSSLIEQIHSPRLRKNLGINRLGDLGVGIKSVEVVEPEECLCIMVSHPSHLYVTTDYIVTHNTELALKIAEGVASRVIPGSDVRRGVLIFSMEMSALQIAERSIANAGRMSVSVLRNPASMDDEGWARVANGMSQLADLDVWVVDASRLSVEEIRSIAERHKQENPNLSLIMADYLGLIEKPKADRNDLAIAHISGSLKAMAKDLKTPVISLSQLSRDVEKRPNKRPTNADLRDSGSIEQDADSIIMLYREAVYDENSSAAPFAEIIVTKNRFGSLGTVYQRFCNGHFVACDQDEARQICTASNAPAARGRRYAQGADV
ncbi:TPA: DNA helicase [Escherichia coli]|nr:DNA helicase [Escherichia coli]HAN8486261.1 DNA helicase [Escherichia coli]